MVELQSQRKAAPDSQACVVVFDDDRGSRESLERLLRSAGLHARASASIAEFLRAVQPDSPTCQVLDSCYLYKPLAEADSIDCLRRAWASGKTA